MQLDSYVFTKKFFNYPKIVERLIELAEDKTLGYLRYSTRAGRTNGGFNWGATIEGVLFWDAILVDDEPENACGDLPIDMRDLYLSNKGLTKLLFLGYSVNEANEIMASIDALRSKV